MKKLEIIIKPERLEELKVIMEENGATGLMITNIMGYGNQKGYTQMYRGTKFTVNLLPKIKIESVLDDDKVEPLIEKITSVITTGAPGDGKIFLYNVEDAIRVRTGERGSAAL